MLIFKIVKLILLKKSVNYSLLSKTVNNNNNNNFRFEGIRPPPAPAPPEAPAWFFISPRILDNNNSKNF